MFYKIAMIIELPATESDAMNLHLLDSTAIRRRKRLPRVASKIILKSLRGGGTQLLILS